MSGLMIDDMSGYDVDIDSTAFRKLLSLMSDFGPRDHVIEELYINAQYELLTQEDRWRPLIFDNILDKEWNHELLNEITIRFEMKEFNSCTDLLMIYVQIESYNMRWTRFHRSRRYSESRYSIRNPHVIIGVPRSFDLEKFLKKLKFEITMITTITDVDYVAHSFDKYQRSFFSPDSFINMLANYGSLRNKNDGYPYTMFRRTQRRSHSLKFQER